MNTDLFYSLDHAARFEYLRALCCLPRAEFDARMEKALRRVYYKTTPLRDAVEAAGYVLHERREEIRLAQVKEALARKDYLAIIHITTGELSAVWAAAMTAHYGPVGIHGSRLTPLGTPNAKTRQIDMVRERMGEAVAKLTRMVEGWAHRGRW